MSERYYLDEPLQPGPVELHGPEAHHLAAVCRVRPGDAVCLFNGDGREYPARVVQVGRRAVTLDVHGVRQPARELPFRLDVAAPLPKGDRGPFLVEKLTELGVTTFRPLSCQRSIVHPREGKLDKLERHVIEASKQCGRNILMRVEALTDWADCCRPAGPDTLGLLAHPAAGEEAAQLGRVARQVAQARAARPDLAVRLAVGPEGGFTDEEVAAARAGGWRPIDLGPRILRVETAALTLAALCIAWLSAEETGGP